MRLRFICLGWALISSSAVMIAQERPSLQCTDLHLVPAVRDCNDVTVRPIHDGLMIVLPHRSDIAEDAFTQKELAGYLIDNGYKVEHNTNASPIYLLRTGDTLAKSVLAKADLHFDHQMHDEGYVLVPFRKGLAVIADTSAGLFYGAQTVKQLIRGSGKDPILLVPTIRDWPAMPHRGLSDDWSRGPLPNMDFLRREIRTLAYFKINIFSPYFEHTFAYNSSPVTAFPGGSLLHEEARELVAYAAQYHITIIPEQESFGHLHQVLKFERYSHLGETAHGSVLAPGDTATLPQIKNWFDELAQVFPGPWVHIGADETLELGFGRTHGEIEEKGLGAAYLNFLSLIHKTLEPNNKKLLFWGDIAEHSPELVGTLPRDMIAVPWEYDAKPDFKPLIEPFTKAGLETWVAPGVNNWNRIYPNNNVALANIRGFVRDGQKMGSTGVLLTVWNDDGETIFDANWVGVLFGAAASWQTGDSDEQAFLDSFGQAFHRDETGKISRAQRELMKVHSLLTGARLDDAQDRYFWVDPFSAEGRQVAETMRPITRELRLHAEMAIQLTAEARAEAREKGRALDNSEALDMLELGARRLDFMALKFQAADECIAFYAQAQALNADKSRQADVSRLKVIIGGMNGRVADIRDGYALLRGLYEQAWLRVNRPYWLQINLARFDTATQLWTARADHWRQAGKSWRNTGILPSAADLNLPESSTE